MLRTIVIDDIEYKLVHNAFTPIAYRAEFGKDYFQDLFSMLKNDSMLKTLSAMPEGEELDASTVDLSVLSDFDMTFFNRIFWVLAKSVNPKIKPYEQFFMDMESFPIKEVGEVVMEMIGQGLKTKKK